ncbi:MAG: PilT/PilU family type 4a pilus ATPase [Alphaproteobacteria bacterium]|nr:PilT/PilU family type 4a pilus ATPase [Alphaproteobacteria bacterium]
MTLTLDALMQEFVSQNATDMYLSVGSPPTLRFGQAIAPIKSSNVLTNDDITGLLRSLLNEDAVSEFESALEYNTAFSWRDKARVRVNVFRQQQNSGVVMRRIQMNIPTLEELSLPQIYGDLIMEKRGLILVVGPTGSGKSTSLASMLEHRNLHGAGHIVTIEDPVEYIHTPKNCIITQRDVGIDTYSFSIALKNMLRQTPDVIVIGEIRDRETMEQAIIFSETGHLCLATLHSNNTNQAIERIINFFPDERHKQILLNLSLNLKAILSQRLVPNTQGKRSIALEILRNEGLIKNLIQEGRVREIKACIENGHDSGMQTFDQALLELCISGHITEEAALAEADNPSNLRLAMKQRQMAALHKAPLSSEAETFKSSPQF